MCHRCRRRCRRDKRFNLFSHLAIILEGLFATAGGARGRLSWEPKWCVVLTVCGPPVQFSNANYCNLLFTNAHILYVYFIYAYVICECVFVYCSAVSFFDEEVVKSPMVSMFDCLPLLNTLNTHTHLYAYKCTYTYTRASKFKLHTHIYWGAHLAWLAALSSPRSLLANTAVVAAKYLFIVVVSVLE